MRGRAVGGNGVPMEARELGLGAASAEPTSKTTMEMSRIEGIEEQDATSGATNENSGGMKENGEEEEGLGGSGSGDKCVEVLMSTR